MMHSSASLMAADVTIRCRIRRSPSTDNPKFEQAHEMTCTMRNWEQSSRRRRHAAALKGALDAISGSNHSRHHQEGGPELFLTPVMEEVLMSRDESPVRRLCRSSRPDESAILEPTMSIPIHAIVVVDCYSPPGNGKQQPPEQRRTHHSPKTDRQAKNRLKIYITTTNLGYFEFQCMNRNGHDILMAFLTASIDADRILDRSLYKGGSTRSLNCIMNDSASPPIVKAQSQALPDLCTASSVTSFCSGDDVLDVDALTAAHLRESQQSETWPERMTRRMTKVVSSLTDLCQGASMLCEYPPCCCSGKEQQQNQQYNEIREPPAQHPTARPVFNYSDLELDEEASQYSTASRRSPNNKSKRSRRSMDANKSSIPEEELDATL